MKRLILIRKILVPLAIACSAVVLFYLLWVAEPALESRALRLMSRDAYEIALKLVQFALCVVVAFALVRVAQALLFSVVFVRRTDEDGRAGGDAPKLVQDIFAIVAYAVVLTVVFKTIFPEVPLGAALTTSAVVGVILGLALQDTLGNLFAGISLHADNPFAVGDVITVNKWTGTVESVTWRAIKIRTFQNHIVHVSNSSVAKEAIEVCPRANANAQLVFFNALYTDSPSRVIDTVFNAVHDAPNVVQTMPPVVRIRNLGESGVDYEVKYWLENYALHSDTDALVRQRIWYAFRRAGLHFAFPTRTLYVNQTLTEGTASASTNGRLSHAAQGSEPGEIVERLAGIELFAPLAPEEFKTLAKQAREHTFAPGETIIRRGDGGASMFIVHQGTVEVLSTDGARTLTVATLKEGDFFGEMALLTGQPRTASVVAQNEVVTLEVGYVALKKLFDTNAELVEKLGEIAAARHNATRAMHLSNETPALEPSSLLSTIRRFFRVR